MTYLQDALNKRFPPDKLMAAATAGAEEIRSIVADIMANTNERFMSPPGALTMSGEGYKIGLLVPDGQILDTLDQQGGTLQDLSNHDLLRARNGGDLSVLSNDPGTINTIKQLDAEIERRGIDPWHPGGSDEDWANDLNGEQAGAMSISMGKPAQEATGDRAIFNDTPFWSGSASTIDGKIEEVHPYYRAEHSDFHHSIYFSQGQIEKMDTGENLFFWIDKNTQMVNTAWRRGEATPELVKKITAQIKFLPLVSTSTSAVLEVVIPVDASEYGNSKQKANPKVRPAIEKSLWGARAAMKKKLAEK